jgi:hypothetical protein
MIEEPETGAAFKGLDCWRLALDTYRTVRQQAVVK